jgi:hypothetical protein
MPSGSGFPRVEQPDLTALEVDGIPRHDREIVDPGGRRDKAIDGIPRSDRVEPPPLFGDVRREVARIE